MTSILRSITNGWVWGVIVTALVVGCSGALSPMAQQAIATELTVYRSPSCGCCGVWIEHMQAAGFQITDELTDDLESIKADHGLPAGLAACHTTLADDYVIEGHIPAADIQRLLTEKPDIAGIAVPGMPIGSPGMEAGDYVEPYTVFAFSASGETASFAEHP